ncbi:Zn-dependent alcohol dehydrogenase [Halobacillus litoralis]|uniref:Zn-dependent alcohol dehydrogenase n=1 Tax=Halobacillus litoralis TaxID=45668 RepID=UPI001CD1DEE9|nr:Zn-dependent alcohol dehydrogenase [Halobacillus litoralis]MCA1021096.1 Zn-dependent alcohol dehydrogenase [Halobacillus litoralis]
MRMKAAVMEATGRPLQVKEVDLQAPKAGEVLIKIEATSICHSDFNALHDPTTPVPAILGHEGAGIVKEVGPHVTKVKVGDRVALNWVPYCGVCEYCISGEFHMCETAFEPMFNGTLLDGTSRLVMDGKPMYHYSLLSTFAEYTVVPELSCVKLPPDMPMAQASLIGCGVATGYGAAVHAAQVKPGTSAAVFGIGGVGINAVQGARIAGARQIIACDVKEQNLEIARQFGATHTINVGKEDAGEALRALTGGFGVHYAIDCSGNTKATESAWMGVRKKGVVVVVGAFGSSMMIRLPAGGFHRMGKTLKGSFYGDVQPFRDFVTISNLYLESKYKLDELILNRVQLEDINAVFDSFHQHSCVNVGRSLIEFSSQVPLPSFGGEKAGRSYV